MALLQLCPLARLGTLCTHCHLVSVWGQGLCAQMRREVTARVAGKAPGGVPGSWGEGQNH